MPRRPVREDRRASWKALRRAHLVLVGSLLVALAGCADGAPSTLEPRGPGAARVEGLWWLLFWVSLAVFVVVVVLLIIATLRAGGRVERDVDRSEVRWGEPFIVVAGVVVPAVVLTAVFMVSLRDMNALSSPEDDVRLTIEVVAHDWWWEARYPNGAVTANEIHIPVGEPVRLKLSTADVIHSFWVPQLQVKMDHIPGKTNHMWLQADQAGRYRGLCAEYCGLQHANMLFYVVAEPQEEFDSWLAKEAEPAGRPADETARRGEQVFMSSSCVGCHAIRGTEATAQLGPDLTHLDARKTIGAGILENTRDNLRRFIAEPQDVKPGVTMPPAEISADDLEAMLDYLEQLD